MTQPQTNEVYDLTAFDDIEDFSSLSVIDSTGLVASQPKNRISTKGKLFTFQFADGTEEDAGTQLDAIILNASPYQSRAYFDGSHDDTNSKLACASSNGVAPDKWIKDPKSKSCVLCPKNQIGSGQDGKGKACKESKDIAVLVPQYPTTPFLIRMSLTSIISFRNYVTDLTKQLRTAGKIKDPKGIAPLHVFLVQLSFKTRDHKGGVAAFPILDFKMLRTVAREKFDLIKDMATGEEVKKLIRIDDVSLAEHNQPSEVIMAEGIASSEVHHAEVIEPIVEKVEAKKVVTPKKAADAAAVVEAKLAALNNNSFVV